jgi:hypothetical protein
MSSKSCRAYKIYSINITGVNQTVPKFVSINNASGAPSVLPVSSNSSLLNPTLDPANNTNTNSPATNTGPTDQVVPATTLVITIIMIIHQLYNNNIPSNSDNANTHTNTDTNTNNKGHNHHSTIIPSTAHNADNNANTNNEQQTRSNTGGGRDININSNAPSSSISLGSASSSSNTIGTNTDKNIDGLAQKIITNVKDKIKMPGYSPSLMIMTKRYCYLK